MNEKENVVVEWGQDRSGNFLAIFPGHEDKKCLQKLAEIADCGAQFGTTVKGPAIRCMRQHARHLKFEIGEMFNGELFRMGENMSPVKFKTS